MTVTYTLDPSNVPVDAVRLMIGDTNVSNAALQDEEIQYFIDRYSSGTPTQNELIRASIDAIRAIIAKVESALEEEQAGKVRVRMFNRKDNLLALIGTLEKQLASLAVPSVFAGGIKSGRFTTVENNPVLTEPKFKIDMHSNPEGTYNDTDGD